jgi:hypothetical protein
MMNNLELLQVYNFNKKCRCGTNRDGGYVLAELDGEYDCYISAGVSEEESFSRDFINKYNIKKENSYAFDASINDYPYHYTENIQFIKKYINNVNDENNTNLSFITDKCNNIFLKMDIEGGEYSWLLQIDEDILNKFKQIVIEFHGITNDGWNFSYNDKIKCLEKLSKTHYIVHAHGNNYAPLNNNIPDVIELTYVNKQYFDLVPELNTTPLPIVNLDFPNWGSNDINLNFYPFVNEVINIVNEDINIVNEEINIVNEEINIVNEEINIVNEEINIVNEDINIVNEEINIVNEDINNDKNII